MRQRQFGSGLARVSRAELIRPACHGVAVFLVALAAFCLPQTVFAQADNLAGVAVIDTERATKEATAFISLNQQMQERSGVFEEEIRQIQNQLQEEEQQLEGQRALLSNDAFQERVEAFQARVNDAQRGVNERKRLLDEAYLFGRQQIKQELRSIILQLAQERGYRLILNWELADTMVIFADPSLDITNEVVALLNEHLPSVSLPQQ